MCVYMCVYICVFMWCVGVYVFMFIGILNKSFLKSYSVNCSIFYFLYLQFENYH